PGRIGAGGGDQYRGGGDHPGATVLLVERDDGDRDRSHRLAGGPLPGRGGEGALYPAVVVGVGTGGGGRPAHRRGCGVWRGGALSSGVSQPRGSDSRGRCSPIPRRGCACRSNVLGYVQRAYVHRATGRGRGARGGGAMAGAAKAMEWEAPGHREDVLAVLDE